MIYALCFATIFLTEEAKLKIGYARVSTNDQNLSNQIALLKEAGCKEIFEEKISGAKKSRPQLERLLDKVREDDTLIVCKLDRLARSTHHLLEIVETLRERKASFYSLGEPWADTTTKELILKLREEGKSATELAKTFNVDRSTVYRL